MNDADDDDIDVYDGGIRSSARNHVAFDATLRDEDHHISIGSSSARSRAEQGPVSALLYINLHSERLTSAGQESSAWNHADI